MQLAENWSARRTPCQGTTCFGARQRKSPTGGAAKGIPLNATIAGSLPETPETSPPSTLIGCSVAPKADAATRIRTAELLRMDNSCNQIADRCEQSYIIY